MESDPSHDHRSAPVVSATCRVTGVRHFGRYALITLLAPGIAKRALPGQFVMVGVPGPGFHLRRPLSIHTVAGEAIGLLVEPRGTGSGTLSEVAAADELQVAGPLGSAFPIHPDAPALVLGGGIGVAPLQFLVERLLSTAVPVTVAFGFRDAQQARLVSAFDIDELWVTTDDGSVGRRGTVVDLAEGLHVDADAVVYVCGPWPMLSAVRRWAGERGLRGFVSLEAHMACGSGACQGCVVATSAGYRRVCVDGPVFDMMSVEALA
jgi:dihydroorotate dehydrogenase electron transfer subunit